jgi:hypothetical protein
VPPDPKDDVQLQLALQLIRGEKTDAKFPPNPNEISQECLMAAKTSAAATPHKGAAN